MKKHLISACLFLASLASPASAESVQQLEYNGNLCARHTEMLEREFNIPQNLLQAIALTESGRWIKETGEKIAWPWTVTSGGAGKFFPNKAQAIAEVKRLREEGVTNIDVGCMQVNLRYHPEAFDNLNEAFEPNANIRYGATFLSELFQRTKSWNQAAAKYHSSHPEKGGLYKDKVMENLEIANASTREKLAEAIPETKQTTYQIQPINRDRTAELNAQYKNRLLAEKKAYQTALNNQNTAPNQRAEMFRQQISQMRSMAGLSNGIAANAALQRARLQQRQNLSLGKAGTTSSISQTSAKQVMFEEKRRAQLDKWRKTVADPVLLAEQQAR